MIYGVGRLQLFFLALLLLHSGVEGKIEDEVYEVIADTFISDRIDLYVSFQEAQDGKLPDDDFLPGAENTGFPPLYAPRSNGKAYIKSNLFHRKPVGQNQFTGGQTVVK